MPQHLLDLARALRGSIRVDACAFLTNIARGSGRGAPSAAGLADVHLQWCSRLPRGVLALLSAEDALANALLPPRAMRWLNFKHFTALAVRADKVRGLKPEGRLLSPTGSALTHPLNESLAVAVGPIQYGVCVPAGIELFPHMARALLCADGRGSRPTRPW